MISARPAVEEDDPAIAELRRLGDSETRSKRGGVQLLDHELGQERDGSSIAPLEFTVVGMIDGDVVGVATVCRPGRSATLTELYTHPEARRVGVGHEMYTAALQQARAWGCSGIDSFALPGDRDTKNFFESHEMKSRLLVVHRAISAEAPIPSTPGPTSAE